MVALMGKCSSLKGVVHSTVAMHSNENFIFLSYSRRIMWLHAAMSNNNPEYIATYFVECVRTIGGENAITLPQKTFN